jgi:hypothetical protein
VDFSCFGYHPDVESRLTLYEKWVLATTKSERFVRTTSSQFVRLALFQNSLDGALDRHRVPPPALWGILSGLAPQKK